MPSYLPPETAFLIERLLNRQGLAEGTILPPRLRGSSRVPSVRFPKVALANDIFGGQQYAISWIEPELVRNVSHYNIYIKFSADGNEAPVQVAQSSRSPAYVDVVAEAGSTQPLAFIVQTVLKGGLHQDINKAPTVTNTLNPLNVSVGYDIQDVIFTVVSLSLADGPEINRQILLNESDEGLIMHIGFNVGVADTNLASRGQIEITVDGLNTAVYPIVFGDTVTWEFTFQSRAENAHIFSPNPGTSLTSGHSWSHLVNIPYKESLLVEWRNTTVGAAGSTGVVLVRRALKI